MVFTLHLNQSVFKQSILKDCSEYKQAMSRVFIYSRSLRQWSRSDTKALQFLYIVAHITNQSHLWLVYLSSFIHLPRRDFPCFLVFHPSSSSSKAHLNPVNVVYFKTSTFLECVELMIIIFLHTFLSHFGL